MPHATHARFLATLGAASLVSGALVAGVLRKTLPALTMLTGAGLVWTLLILTWRAEGGRYE